MRNFTIGILAAISIFAIMAQGGMHAPGPFYGAAYGADQSTAMTDIGTTYTTVTAFTASAGRGITWDAGNDIATITNAGIYFITVQASFSGTGSSEFECAIHTADTTEEDEVHLSRKLGTGGDVGSASANGVLTLAASATVRLKCKGDNAGDDMTPQDVQMTILKIG